MGKGEKEQKKTKGQKTPTAKVKSKKQSRKPVTKEYDSTSSDATKKALLIAGEKSLGVVTSACKSVGCSRSTFYEYWNNDPEFKKDWQALANVALDFAESSLHKQIQSGNPASTIFFLKTKGKKRGYIERLEVTEPQSVGDALDGLTDDELDNLMQELNNKLNG